MFRSTLRCGALTLGCVFAFALASTAGAQLLNHKDLSASIAITIAQTAIETCKANGYAVSATVVGRNGEIIVQVRGDNTGPHTSPRDVVRARRGVGTQTGSKSRDLMLCAPRKNLLAGGAAATARNDLG